MRNFGALFRAGLVGTGLFSLANVALAGTPGSGSIGFVPVTGVPTLSEWTMVVLFGLMALMAFRVLRSRNLNRLAAWLVSAGVFSLASMSGVDLVKQAQAVVGALILSSSSGQTITLNDGGNQIDNTSGVSQRVSAINLGPGTTTQPTMSSPECTVGLVVPNTQSCFIRIQGSGGL